MLRRGNPFDDLPAPASSMSKLVPGVKGIFVALDKGPRLKLLRIFAGWFPDALGTSFYLQYLLQAAVPPPGCSAGLPHWELHRGKYFHKETLFISVILFSK